MTSATIVLPGQPISLPRAAPIPQLGSGLYSRDSEIRASLVGIPQQNGPILSIPRVRARPPAVNSIVLGTITRLAPLQATLSITVVDGIPLPVGEEFTGVIRTQDVRATERDRVKIAESFRGGDVVRAVVISLGDARSYFVSTARNNLGVVFATSETGGTTLVPLNWQEMQDPVTMKIEKRKVAKPES
ncbi:Exosome complex component csl4 [Mycena indigotica]|uniref:Exosome complex component csl4 n=1 Tax=Mycena indigotica TaxID=2126181 RepID=A0A8H6SW60_9AGAR|nr:Exosome complex component csl4 [Mycena indigotica]KAF7307033.1 Exosome complex component csl4 [Mycena indigotica]